VGLVRGLHGCAAGRGARRMTPPRRPGIHGGGQAHRRVIRLSRHVPLHRGLRHGGVPGRRTSRRHDARRRRLVDRELPQVRPGHSRTSSHVLPGRCAWPAARSPWPGRR
jgi:hypothetical protein